MPKVKKEKGPSDYGKQGKMLFILIIFHYICHFSRENLISIYFASLIMANYY